MAASLKVSELSALTTVAAADLILVSDADVSISKKVTLTNLEGSISLANLGTKSIDNLTDVDISTAAPTASQLLEWDAVNSKFVPGNTLATLTGVAAGSTNLGTFTGDIITDDTDIKTALQDLETKIEANDQAAATESALTETDGNVDDLILLSGVAENVDNLGTFTGSTISDSQTVKTALQQLETAVEARTLTTTFNTANTKLGNLISLSGEAANDTNLGVFTGGIIDDSSTIRAALQALETAIEAETTARGQAITDLVDGAPDALNTLNELAAALDDDASAAASLTTLINANEAHIDNLATLTGLDKDTVNFGEFTGSTIADNLTLKSVLQTIETALEEVDANADDVTTAVGIAEQAQDLGTFTGSTIADSSTVKAALQALETKAEDIANDLSSESSTRASADTTLTSDLDEVELNQGDLVTLTGVDENSTTLGTFTGSTLANNETIKSALQDLVTAVELKTDDGDNVNQLVGTTTPDSEPANYYFLVVDAATGAIKVINKEFVETEGSN